MIDRHCREFSGSLHAESSSFVTEDHGYGLLSIKPAQRFESFHSLSIKLNETVANFPACSFAIRCQSELGFAVNNLEIDYVGKLLTKYHNIETNGHRGWEMRVIGYQLEYLTFLSFLDDCSLATALSTR